MDIKPHKTKEGMKSIIIFLGLKFEATQHKWGRKLFGGKWYKISNNLSMYPFWSDEIITSCQGRVIKEESY